MHTWGRAPKRTTGRESLVLLSTPDVHRAPAPQRGVLWPPVPSPHPLLLWDPYAGSWPGPDKSHGLLNHSPPPQRAMPRGKGPGAPLSPTSCAALPFGL